MRHNPNAVAHRPLTSQQQDLIVQWLPLAFRQLNHFTRIKMIHNNHFAKEELISCTHMSLVKAAQAFKPESGYKFGTYMGRILSTDLPKCLAKCMQNRLLTISDQQDLYESFTARDSHESWDDESWRDIGERIDEHSDELTAKICELHNRDGLTRREIASYLEISIGLVHQAIERLRSNSGLRQEMAQLLQ